MRLKGSAEFLEARRRKALRLLSEGRSLHEVAGIIRCAASSVMRWQQAWRSGGEKALRVRSSPGRPSKLKAAEQRQLLGLLRRGARACGYSSDLWTTARISELIEGHFGVKYHRDHVGRLMHGLGWIHDEPSRGAGVVDERRASKKQTRRSGVGKIVQGWIPASSSAEAGDFSRPRSS